MKFILNEEPTFSKRYILNEDDGPNENGFYMVDDDDSINQKEEKAIRQVMQSKGYAESQIDDTIDAIKKDKNGHTAQHWLNQVNKQQQSSQQTNSEGTQTNDQSNDEQTNDQDTDDNLNNNQEEKEQDINTANLDPEVENTVNILYSHNKEATEAFIKAIKGQIKNPNYPFTKLLTKGAFIDALFSKQNNESLTEASPFGDLANNIKGKIKDSKENRAKKVSNKDPVIKFIKIYNAFTKLDNNIANEYISSNDPLIYKSNILSQINNDDPIDKIINIDVATVLNNDPKLRSQLYDAIKHHYVDAMSTYKFDGNDNSDLKRVEGAFNKLSDNDKQKFINGLKKSKGANK